MAREFKRSVRVAEVIQREVSMLLVSGVKDPRLGLVTVTGAKVSDDLKHAVVYYNVHGDDAEREATQRGLDSAAGFFRSHLRRVTDLKYIPELRFRYDASIDEGEKIDRLLREVGESDGQ